MDEEIPKYRKKKGKKKFKIRWKYKGELPTFTNELSKLFFFPIEQKYHSERAAHDALKAWKEGRGFYDRFSPEKWEPIVEEL